MRSILPIPFALWILLAIITVPSALGCGCQTSHCPSTQNRATDKEFIIALPSVYEPGVDCSEASGDDQGVPIDSTPTAATAAASDATVMRSSLAAQNFPTKDTTVVTDMRPQLRATAARLAVGDYVYV